MSDLSGALGKAAPNAGYWGMNQAYIILVHSALPLSMRDLAGVRLPISFVAAQVTDRDGVIRHIDTWKSSSPNRDGDRLVTRAPFPDGSSIEFLHARSNGDVLPGAQLEAAGHTTQNAVGNLSSAQKVAILEEGSIVIGSQKATYFIAPVQVGTTVFWPRTFKPGFYYVMLNPGSDRRFISDSTIFEIEPQ